MTIGARIEKLTKTYTKMYERFKKDPDLKRSAEPLAMCDPYQNLYVWEKVKENVEAYIKGVKVPA